MFTLINYFSNRQIIDCGAMSNTGYPLSQEWSPNTVLETFMKLSSQRRVRLVREFHPRIISCSALQTRLSYRKRISPLRFVFRPTPQRRYDIVFVVCSETSACWPDKIHRFSEFAPRTDRRTWLVTRLWDWILLDTPHARTFLPVPAHFLETYLKSFAQNKYFDVVLVSCYMIL